MKIVLRAIVFVLISMLSSQYVIGGFNYGEDISRTFLIVIVSLSIIFLVMKPLLKLISLPTKGVLYFILLFALCFASLFSLNTVLPSFSIEPVSLSGLIIFGFVLPSKDLTSIESALVSSLVVSLVYSFMQTLCSKK
ncbi:MAG TPA: hypothetical protein PKK07_01680 [bacterium]|nr:hypothetical protein [bacterium]HOA18415.1 hypothetical protein [bacterium]